MLIIIQTKQKKHKKKGKNKYTANSYNIYITILVRCWKIFRGYFSVRSAGGAGREREKSSLVVPLVVVFKVLVFVVILVFVWEMKTHLKSVEIQRIKLFNFSFGNTFIYFLAESWRRFTLTSVR